MPALVGRDPELATIDRFLRSVHDGSAALALRGRAGYGKSALLRETVGRASELGFRVLEARAAEIETELPFGNLAELLDPAVATSELELPAPQVRALEIALRRADPDERPVDPLALALAVLATLRELASRSPVLVALDDLQWCDPPSLRALDFALRRIEERPVGFVAAVRSGGEHELRVPFPGERVENIEVGPLDEAAFGVAVRRISGTPLSAPAVRRLHAACDGNPLFGGEVAILLWDRGVRADSAVELPVPPSTSAAIHARLARLEPGTRDTLLTAAALPRPTIPVLAGALGDDVVETALAEAARAGVVTLEGDRVAFSHPLVAAAVYGAATPRRQRDAHARLARTLGSREERAPHLALAAPGPDAGVAAELEAAADAAAARGALDAAARLLEQAASATPDLDAARRRRLCAARSHFAAGDTARAKQILDELLVAAPAGVERAAIRFELARAAEEHLETCLEHAHAALAEAEGDPLLEMRVRQFLADQHLGAGEAERGAEHAHAALALARASGVEGAIATATALVACFDFWLGRAVRLDELEEAVEIDRRLAWSATTFGERPISALAGYLKRIGSYDRSRALHLEHLDEAVERGDERERASVLMGLADLEQRAGRLDRARSHAAEVAELGNQLDDRGLRAYGLLRGGAVLALLGDADEAETFVRTGRELCEGVKVWLAWADHVLGLVELERGRPPEALKLFDSSDVAMAAAGVREPASQLPTAVEALLALGRVDEADARVASYESRCSRELHARALALTARYRALIASLRGEHEQAERAFAESLELQALAPSPYDRARTLVALATARRRQRRRGAARTALEEAIDLFERAGAGVWAERARSDLAALGLRRGAADELTPMEERVARTVATGATNREAAASLFLSERTIEFHLRSAYRKLGLRSRTELAAVLSRRESGAREELVS